MLPSVNSSFRPGVSLSFLLCITLLSSAVRAQPEMETAVILGKVTDAPTGLPIENVNAYLSNTMKGSWTTPDGAFILKGIPVGVCELVISRVGYVRIIATLTIIRAETLLVEYALADSLLQVGEVSVTQDRDEEWESNLQRFRAAFLGPSPFAGECTILNPEVLSLEYANDTLTASATGPLRIENKALGYRLTIVLDQFVWNTDRDYGAYKMYPFFEELTPGDREESASWMENRRSVWEGSLKHFLQTLYQGNSEEESFTIHTGPLGKLVNGQGHRVLSTEFPSDSIGGTDLRKIIIANPLRIEYGFVENGIETSLRRPGRKPLKGIAPVDSKMASLFHVKDSVVILDSRGNLFDPLTVEVAGRWGASRVAELFPIH